MTNIAAIVTVTTSIGDNLATRIASDRALPFDDWMASVEPARNTREVNSHLSSVVQRLNPDTGEYEPYQPIPASLAWLNEPTPRTRRNGIAKMEARAEAILSAYRSKALSAPCVEPDEVRDVTCSDDKPPVIDSQSRWEIRCTRALHRYENTAPEGWWRVKKSTGISYDLAQANAAPLVDEWHAVQNRLDVRWLHRDDVPTVDYDEDVDRDLRTRRGVQGEHAWTLEVLAQLRTDWATMRRRAMRVRGCSASEAAADPQVEAIARHATSMRHRFNYRRYIAALASTHLDPQDGEDRGSLIYAQQLALVEAWRKTTKRSYAEACEVLARRVNGTTDRWLGVEGLISAAPRKSRGERWEYVAPPAPALRVVEPHRGSPARRYTVATAMDVREMYARTRDGSLAAPVSVAPSGPPPVTVEFAEKAQRWHHRRQLLAPRTPRWDGI